MNPKRRWWPTIVAVVVLAGLAGFAVLPKLQQDDSPRFVILRQERVNGQVVVVFRFDGPKLGSLSYVAMTAQNALTGDQSKPVVLRDDGDGLHEVDGEHTLRGRKLLLSLSPVAGAARSTELRIIPPTDNVWRLRCDVALVEAVYPDGMMRDLLRRVGSCWRTKSLLPMSERQIEMRIVTIESELITNAVPPAAEDPPLDSTGIVTNK